MDILKDSINVNKKVLDRTLKSLKKSWMIIFTGIVYMIINLVMYTLIATFFRGIFSILAGIVAAIFSAAMISNYLYLLFNVINYDKIVFQDFKDGFGYFLRKIYSVFFFAWIGSYLISMLGGILGLSLGMLNSIISLSILVLLNALPETIYLKSYDGLDSIMYSLEFMKDNWYNWLIPNIIMYFILYVITGNIITDLFATSISYNLIFSPLDFGRYLIGQIIFSFIMIYRGHLYKILSTSNRRKRLFMRKF